MDKCANHPLFSTQPSVHHQRRWPIRIGSKPPKYLVAVQFMLIAIMFLPALTVRADHWWNENWRYRQHIKIDASSVCKNLADFPLSVRLPDALFARTLTKPAGEDLRAIGADGQLLDLEIVSWTVGDVQLYVRIPEIKAGIANQGFDLYFGNPSANAALATHRIWDDSYLTVLHLAGNMKDATGHASTADKEGYVVQNGWTAGLIMSNSFPWVTFESGHKGYLAIKPAVAQTAGPNLTFVCRFRPARMASMTLCSGDGFSFGVHNTQAVCRIGTSDLTLEGVKTGQWQCGVFSYDATTGIRTICLGKDGFATDKPAPTALKTERIRIGREISDAKESQFDGDIEEVRLRNDTPSTAWLKATALNLSEEDPLVQIGGLEEFGLKFAPPPPPQLIRPADGAQSFKRVGIKLEWLPSVGASSYDVLIFKDANGQQPLKTIAVGAATAISLTAGQANGSDVYWTVAAKSDHGETRAKQLYQLTFHSGNEPDKGLPCSRTITPQLVQATNLDIQLKGYFGGRIARVAQYMIDFTKRNPGLLRMLRERPEKDVPPWAGVFPGQYLSSAQLIWRLTHNPKLKTHIDAYVRELIDAQRGDGYLGPFDGITDPLALWNHYAILTGLLDYYDDTGYKPALDAARKILDLVIRTYGPNGLTFPKTGGASEAISHATIRLYRVTRDPRYLNLTNYIIHEVWSEPGGVDFYNLGQGHPSVNDFPVRRWEGINNIMALAEMYWATGNANYKNAFVHLWQTLLQTEVHNTGGFSTDEGLLDSPDKQGTIETCCTVAWSLLSTDMLRLSGNSHVADELEFSAFNSALASIPYDGSCSTYDNPPDGYRHFCPLKQGPPDGPELFCCSTNAPRALGNIANWALMQKQGGLVLNYYGPSKISTDLPSGNRVSFEQVTEYPARGNIQLNVSAHKPEIFTLYLRIPAWSKQTQVTLNGNVLSTPPAGSYLPIRRKWATGDIIKLLLDFTPRFLIGKEDYAGRVSVYQGPMLLTYDTRYDLDQRRHLSPLNINGLTITPIKQHDSKGPWVLARMTDGDGKHLTVCDFSSAGLFGDYFQSWFDLKRCQPTPFVGRDL